MGYSTAVKAIPGGKTALSLTIPLVTGIHRRMIYTELKEGFLFEKIATTIKANEYFVYDKTYVI